jgi:predicted transglutaminase-like cysteine proteinase
MFSKSRAILGGASSQLDLIMARQGSPRTAAVIAVAGPMLPALPANATAVASPSGVGIVGTVTAASSLDRPAPLSSDFGAPESGMRASFASPFAPAPMLRPTNAPDVFGSVAMPVRHTALDAKWHAVGRSNLGKGPWSALIRATSFMDRVDRIAAVNHWVNARISFASDVSTRAKGDDWAGAARSLRSGRGDCEDYAIAKLQILRAMGFGDEDLYLVIARDLVRRADHAILAVRIGGAFAILDNETDALLDGRAAQDYRPIFSYSGNQAWIHGYRLPVSAPSLASETTARTFQVASR